MVDNTRLNSQGSQIALTTRFQTMEFANLYIAYTTQVAEGGKVETPLEQVEQQITYTPDTRLLTTLSTGVTTEEDTQSTQKEITEGCDPDATEPEEAVKGCKATAAGMIALMITLAACALTLGKKEE